MVAVVLGDASAEFPAARSAGAFAHGELGVAQLAGARAEAFDNQRAIRLTAPRAVIGLLEPAKGRFALRLVVRLRQAPKPGARFTVRLEQRTARRTSAGGAAVVFVSP